MNKLISTCPCCSEHLKITTLQCPSCGMAMSNNFELSPFDKLDHDQYEFLITFLKQRGNLKNLQIELGISYPTAKKKLDELLTSLELHCEDDDTTQIEIDITGIQINRNSTLPSDIIKARLADCGGRATVYTATGLPCEIWADADGETFVCNKLPIKPNYAYSVFDVIIDLLLSQGGSAKKGNGRINKLGEPNCDHTTVVGTVATHRKAKPGDSVFDPVFVLAAILEWANITHNKRGELVLTQDYRRLL